MTHTAVAGYDPVRQTILLVDDEPLLRRALWRLLKGGGYNVLSCESGGEAIQACQRGEPIDLLLIDVRLRDDVRGPAVADTLRSLRPGLKALFMSGAAREALVEEGVLPAESLFVEKPFSNESVLHEIRSLIGNGPRARRPVEE